MRLSWLVLVALASPVAPAYAQSGDAATVANARSLAKDAKDAADAGDWAHARDLYHRAGELLPAPTLMLREARCMIKLGTLVEASELLHKVSRWPLEDRPPEAFRAARDDANTELAELSKRIPSIKLVVAETGASALRFDGKPTPLALLNVDRPVDPGTHTIDGTIGGIPILVQRVRLAEGEHLEVVVHAAEAGTAPPAQPATQTQTQTPAATDGTDRTSQSGGVQRAVAFGALGVGVVGLGVGIATGLVATGKNSDLRSVCPNNACPASAQSDIDSFRSLRTVSTVGYVIGAVGVAGGVILLLTAPKATPSPPASGRSVTPWIGLGSAGLAGSF